MHDSRIPATAGDYHGELRLTLDGLSFVPVTTRRGNQMVLGVTGWHLAWRKVAGIERVGPADIRVHYDDLTRFVAVAIHGSVQEFFRDVDALIATGAAPMRLAS